MSTAPRNNNYYWNNGAFCENCGILTGNVTNNGIYPIWHAGCKPGCNSVWEDQDPIVSDDEYDSQDHGQEEPLFEDIDYWIDAPVETTTTTSDIGNIKRLTYTKNV